MKKAMLLFLTMLKIGLFTFGGGYAMIALLENEFVEKKKWIEKDEFLNMVAIAESTPGPIAINSATYIGYKIAGFLGSLFATIGVIVPSFIIIFSISLFFDAFLSLTYVAYAFRGIQVAVVYLIMTAGIKMARAVKANALEYVIFFATMTLMIVFSLFEIGFSSIFYILGGGLTGLFIFLIGRIKRDKGEDEAK